MDDADIIEFYNPRVEDGLVAGSVVTNNTTLSGSINGYEMTASIVSTDDNQRITVSANQLRESPYAVISITSSLPGTDYNYSMFFYHANSSFYEFWDTGSAGMQTVGGTNNSGAERRDALRLQTNAPTDVSFTLVSGDTTTSTEINISGTNTNTWNELSQSIKTNTVFDDITITPLTNAQGQGYALFELTASLTSREHNGTLSFVEGASSESGGARTSFLAYLVPAAQILWIIIISLREFEMT